LCSPLPTSIVFIHVLRFRTEILGGWLKRKDASNSRLVSGGRMSYKLTHRAMDVGENISAFYMPDNRGREILTESEV